MDKDKIIEKFKKDKPTMKLADGRLVVGSYVPDKGYLQFIIKDGNKFTIEPAQGQRIAQDLKKRPQVFVKVRKID